MENRSPRDKGAIWGVVLVCVGALFLLQTTGTIQIAWKVAVALGFLVGATIFGSVFVMDRHQWWALFPAVVLGFIGLDGLLPNLPNDGTIFLGGLGLAFAAVYASNRQQWWAIIPSGVLLTLGLITLFDAFFPFLDTGWLFFAGLALTFGLVWWETRPQNQWAAIPATACGALSALIVIGSLMKYVFPLALVGVGVYMLMRRDRSRTGPE